MTSGVMKVIYRVVDSEAVEVDPGSCRTVKFVDASTPQAVRDAFASADAVFVYDGKFWVPLEHAPASLLVEDALLRVVQAAAPGFAARTLPVDRTTEVTAQLPSAVVYTPFWDSVGYGLPEFAGRLLNFNAVVNRNVEDASITLPDKKRDYMVHLLKRLLIGVYAMELGSDAPLTPIIDEFEIASSLGRRKVINLFINLTRWVHTVHAMGLLPPPPPASLAIPFNRPSPYPDMGEVELTLHFKHVTKSFAVPISHLHELLDVYTTLAELGMPDVIRCRSFKIGGREVDLSHEARRTLPRGKTVCHVELKLGPVGACFIISNDNQLRSLVASLLSTLCQLHEVDQVVC
ncbi:hypothetical protein WJX72_011294 [[Myrmecia] bisecta]|uniref:Uncharacterized protein n=1 Tax=[Myrmecia] bisecta TaxID=41462 RepID=A0AAW1QSY0_9CHLO